MPGSKLSKNDFMDESFLKGVQDARKEIRGLLTDFKKLAKEAKTVSDGIKLAKTFNEVTKAAKKTSDTTKKLTAEERKLESATKALAFENSKAGKEWHKINEAKKLAAKRNRELAKAQDTAKKSTSKFTFIKCDCKWRIHKH